MAKNKSTSHQELHHQLQEITEKHRRALADYQNLEKRISQQRADFTRLANVGLIIRILTLLDDLERAATHINDSGLDLVIHNFHQLLQDEQVKPIPAAHQVFNPQLMECTDTVPGKKDQVIQVLQPGYTLGDTVIRPAKVQVGSGSQK